MLKHVISETAKAGKKFRILIIEDNSMMARDIETFLRDSGFTEIHVVQSDVDAIELVHEKNQIFDLVSSDYNLEGAKNGITLLRFLFPNDKTSNKPKQIIYTIGGFNNFDEIVKKCKEEGFDILLKTADHRNLVQHIETHYRKNTGLPENPSFSEMTNFQLLSFLAKDLIADLSAIKDQSKPLYLSTNSSSLSISDLIDEVASLTPIGKEILGMWFESQRKTMLYYENKKN